MATEFNYVVNLDTSRVMGQMAEVRSQVGMSLGSATGFAAPAMAMPGGGFGDMAGGAAAGFAQMAQGLSRPPAFMGGLQGQILGSSFGGTFTNSAMAYSPHYGMVQAETNLNQEWLVHRYGMPAANMFKPPGVSGFEYAMGSEKNYIDRRMDAERGAYSAMRSTVASGVGGMLAGEGLSMLAAPIGAIAGRSLATKFLGAGAGGAGAFIGGAGLGLLAFTKGSEIAGGIIQEHYAQVEQIGGITTELGDIMGAGRGMGRNQKYHMGRAAREAAKDIGMDVQEMGDIVAGARGMGMLPSSTDPAKLRTQLGEFARSIEEGAQLLHTSLGNAMGIMKNMGGGVGGVERLINMSSAAGISPEAMLGIGMQGASIANQNLLSRSQGFGLFTGATMAAAGSGLSRGEMGMIGGVTGAGAMIASTQMGAALSPMGDLQLMAAQGGGGLGGIFDMAGAAMSSMTAGGDMIGNMVRFQTHKRELLRGTGASGIRTMARAQLSGYADILQGMSPSLSDEDAERFMAQNMFGLNEVQAKAFVGAQGRGGGGGGGGGGPSALLLERQQEVMLSRSMNGLQRPDRSLWDRMTPDSSDPLMGTKYGAAGGALAGSLFGGIGMPLGAGIGAAGGAAYDAYRFFKHSAGGIFDGPGLFAPAQEKADYEFDRDTRLFDQKYAAAKARMGWLPIDPMVVGLLGKTDVSQMQLSLDAVGVPVASSRLAGQMTLAGLQPVMAGPGTMRVNGEYYNTSDVTRSQSLDRKAATSTRSQKDQIYRAGQHSDAYQGAASEYKRAMEAVYSNPAGGVYDFVADGEHLTTSAQVAAYAVKNASHVVFGSGDHTLAGAWGDGAMMNPAVKGALEYASGYTPPRNATAQGIITRAAAIASEGNTMRANAQKWISDNYGMGQAAPDTTRQRPVNVNVGGTTLPINSNSFNAGLDVLGMRSVVKRFIGKDITDGMVTDLVGEFDTDMAIAMASKTSMGRTLVSSTRETVKDPAKAAELSYLRSVWNKKGFRPVMDAYINSDPSDPTAAAALRAFMSDEGVRHPLANSKKMIDAIMNDPTFKVEGKEYMKYPEAAKGNVFGKKTVPGNIERPVGFGEHESAMSSINRSLKMTESMLRALYKGKGGTDVPPAAGDGRGPRRSG